MGRRIGRRDLLKIGAASAVAAALGGCEFPRPWVTLEPHVRPPEEQTAGVATWYASTCRQCPAGCGIIVRTLNGRAVKIEGNPQHPLNEGKLCPRGQAGLQELYNPDRLQAPVRQAVRGSRQYTAITWDDAVAALRSGLAAAGPRTAVWADFAVSGHLLDLFSRLSAALGAPPPLVFDLYTALSGYAALTAADQALFGRAALPTYGVEEADVVLSFAADFLGTWLSTTHYGVAFGSFRQRPLAERGYLAQFEPRSNLAGAKADLWLRLQPGTEALVAQAIARLIADGGAGPADRVARAQLWAPNVDPAAVAVQSGVPLEDLRRLAGTFVTAARPLALPGGAVTGHGNAVEQVAAVQVLNIIAGVTGFGLSPAPPLADLVQPMAAPYGEVLRLVERMRAGDVGALLVWGTANPVYALPPSLSFVDALQQVPLVVSFRPIVDETAVWADLLLPDRTYLESWGYQVVAPSFGEPLVNSQQPVVQPLYDTRATGDLLLEAAQGISAAAAALPCANELAVLRERIAALPPGTFGGVGADVQWARFLQHGFWQSAAGPAALTPPAAGLQPVLVPAPSFQGDAGEFPFFLYIYMPVLLSDGRGADKPWLVGSPDPMTTIMWQTCAEIETNTAIKLGVTYGDIVRITSPYGEVEAPVYVLNSLRPDTIAIPTGLGHSALGRFASREAEGPNPMVLIGPQADASGTSLAWANVRVRVTRTGRSVALAKFENTRGSYGGFINQSFPDQYL
ncbi:MAG TPA: molybdopterin dinucleotide binding domain-containing protein [Anaerolineae bacterium]|nr:molybdopterin dinucleotide binding domain-containing protein [Anaerolineae bacterium]HOR00452.1 molybdopterin dinucleotide binding domain-containing protein [Anaerolineae bacterium]HPL27021.1 molybdopterin dinucleotide binding domain-containing protein [Anaerolineae bacterium]HPL27028.1 molybdopterin dinucleotide binding domain-containing protein [Anaerolineae bacterium]